MSERLSRLLSRARGILAVGPAWWWLAAATILVLQVAGFHSLRHDDAYITFRYGQNLATGNGLVFNPGERIMGSTSPGHVLLSALGYWLVGREALPSVMSALGCLGWIAQAIAVAAILRGALGQVNANLVGLCIAAGAAWSHRFVALETNLAAALIMTAMALGVGSCWIAAACACALAGLMRPDAYIIGLPLGLLCIHDTRAECWKPAAVGAIVSAPWLLFAAWYFGTVVPQSAVSKVQTVALRDYATWLFNYPAMNLLAWRLSFRGIGEIPGIAATAVWIMAAWGAYLLGRRGRRLWVLPASLGMYIAAYLVLCAAVGIEWHLYPVMLLLAILTLAGLSLGAEALLPRHVASHAVVALLLGIAALVGYRSWQYAYIHEHAYWYGARDMVYRRIAEYLRTHADPGDVVAAEAVGTIAYYSQLPILDLEGLITAKPREQLTDPQRRPRWYIWVPDYRGIGAYRGVAAFDGNPASRAAFSAESELIDRDELNLGINRFSAIVLDEGRASMGTAQPEVATESALMRAGLDALFTRRDPQAAAAQFRQVLERNPTHYGATFQLARALDLIGKRADARPLWEKVLRMAERYHDVDTAKMARARLQTSE